MKKSQLVSAIKTVLAEGMPNFKNPTKFETQNDTPEMTKVRKKLHAIQDRQDQFEKDVKANKFSPEKKKEVRNKILDDQQAIFAELQKLAKEAKEKKKEEKKQKLDENTIRQIVKEVLSEEVHGQSALHKLAKSCKSFQEFLQKAMTHLEKASPSTLKTSGTVSTSMKRNLKSIWDERNDDDYDTVDEQQINEEAYDLVHDVTRALNNSRPSQDEVEDYLGRSLSSDELRAFGFNSGTVIGYKHGQPQYAGQGQKKTYTSYARGNSRRSY